jgi:hypothetical protein
VTNTSALGDSLELKPMKHDLESSCYAAVFLLPAARRYFSDGDQKLMTLHTAMCHEASQHPMLTSLTLLIQPQKT